MTVGTKLHQSLVSAEGLVADMKQFSIDTQNKQAKQEYAQLAQQLETATQALRKRVNAAEQEEPQYKVFDQALQSKSQQQQSMQQTGHSELQQLSNQQES